MKKRIILATICMTLALLIAIPALADTASTTTPTALDEHLVVHWDFEGATPEEQLADKAPKGECDEDLVFQADKGENKSTVTDGVLHLDPSNGSAVERRRRNNIEPPVLCTDIESITEGMTVYLKMQVGGTTTAQFSDILDIGNLMRLYVTGTSPTLKVRFTTDAYNSNAHEVEINSILKDQYFYVAISTSYNADTQKLETVSYISFDGEVYLGVEQDFDNVVNYYGGAALNWKGFRFGVPCHFGDRTVIGTTFDFDDIRIYNKVLTEAEIVSLSSTGTTEDTTTEEVTTEPETETEAPETNAPVTNAPETNAPETNATTTETPAKSEDGCGAAIGGVALISLAPIAAIFALSKKKKK